MSNTTVVHRTERVADRETGGAGGGRRWRDYVDMRSLAAVVVVGGLVAYAVILRIGPVELVRAAAGLLLLWGPMTALVMEWLREEVPDRLPRFTFAAASGYALTTLMYFGCGVVAGTWLFYPAQVAVAAAAVAAWRRGRSGRVGTEAREEGGRGAGWVLAALVVVSLLVLSRYQVAERVDPKTGDVRFVANREQTYFVGLAYELGRHTPPVQQVCQAGVPERGYHLLPHLSTMLLARWGGVSDVMRAQLVYNYAVLAVLLCLMLYSIAWRVTGARVAGYVAVSLLVILAIPLPPAVPTPLGYFYFNLFPVATSVLQPTVITSPQMYGGLEPTFAVLLGAVYLCYGLRRGRGVGRLAIVCGVLVAATSRFRVQTFLPLAPGFMGVLAYAWWRSRGGRDRWLIVAAGALTVVLSGLLYMEVRSAYYLHDTATLEVGFYPNYRSWMDAWPGFEAVMAFLRRWLLPEKVQVVRSVLSIVGFTFLVAVGVPSLLAGVAWLVRPRAWREWGAYAGLTVWLVVGSILGALTMRVGYDDYSVGGQMLLQTGWYGLPVLAVVAGGVIVWAQQWVRYPRVWAGVGVAVIAAAGLYQAVRPDDRIERMFAEQTMLFPRNDWRSIQFLRKHTPADAVIISDHHLEGNAAVYPSLAGRAAYVAYVRGTTEFLPSGDPNAKHSRPEIVEMLWRERNPRRFASLLASTGATHLVEFSDHPLKIRPHRCLKAVWVSPTTKGRRPRTTTPCGCGCLRF